MRVLRIIAATFMAAGAAGCASVGSGTSPQQAATEAPTSPTPTKQTSKVASDFSPVADFRCPSPGTMIRTSTGGQFQFTDPNGSRCTYKDENGDVRERYALFADGFGRLARKEMDGLWPLKVGGRTEFDVVDTTPVQPTDRFSQRHFHESFAVTRQERLTVPAGTFDTFVVEWTEKEIGRHHDTTHAVITMWYAPPVGYVVKSSVRIVNANAADPFATTQYAAMTYEASKIVMPNGQTLPVAAAEPPAKETPSPAPVAGSPAPSIAAPPALSKSASPADRLRALKSLLDQKLITPQEYETHRKAILDAL